MQKTVQLPVGFKVGDAVHRVAVLRSRTVGDIYDALDESSKPIWTSEGFKLAAHDFIVGLNVLRRQIVSIGEYPGPITPGEFKKIDAQDLAALEAGAAEIEAATKPKTRSDGAPEVLGGAGEPLRPS